VARRTKNRKTGQCMGGGARENRDSKKNTIIRKRGRKMSNRHGKGRQGEWGAWKGGWCFLEKKKEKGKGGSREGTVRGETNPAGWV